MGVDLTEVERASEQKDDGADGVEVAISACLALGSPKQAIEVVWVRVARAS